MQDHPALIEAIPVAEETFTLELSSVKEDYDRALEVGNDLKLKKW